MATDKGTLSLGNRTTRKARTRRRGKVQVDMATLERASYETHKNLFDVKKTENTGEYQTASQRGFFGEEDEELSSMGWHEESVVSTFESATTPEQIAAGRIAAGGASASAAFMNNATLAKKILATNVNPTMFKHSMIPAEQLAYMSHKSGLDVSKVSREVKSGISSEFDYSSSHFDTVGIAPEDIESRSETGFNQSLRQARVGGINQKEIKDPTQQMLTTFGALTVANDPGRMQVTAPDSVSFGLQAEFDAKTNQSIIALERLANLYLPADKRGFTNLNNSSVMGKTKEQIQAGALRNEIMTALGKQLPQSIANVGKAMSENPGHKIPWATALPSPESLGVSRSTAKILVNPYVNKFNRTGVNASIAKMKALYNAGNESGLSRSRNTDFYEAKYIADELAASGMDPKHTVLSQDSTRDQMHSFRVTTDVRESMSLGMKMLGMTSEDLKDPIKAAQLRNKILSTTEQERIDAEEAPSLKELNMPKHQDRSKSIFTTSPINMNPSDAWRSRNTSQLSGDIKPDMNREADKAYRPTSRGAQVGYSTQSPAEALADFKKSNPHITGYISDGKDEYGNIDEGQHAKWQAARKGKLSSSIAAGMAGERAEDTAGGIASVIRSGLGIEGKRFDGNAMTQSGNILEPKALDWYRRKYDSSAFETGMIERADKPGQSTTPDAMARGGKKVVEVKSRNEFIDRSNPTPNQTKALGKYNMQMQHQMYMTDATSADLVQVRRSAENPNKQFGSDAESFRKDTFERDEELIGRMKPVWDRVGVNASKIAGLSKSDQDALSKAVETGNIKSFEKLSAKHGLDEAVIGTALGKTPKAPRQRSDIIDALGGAGGPNTFGGITKTALSRNRFGRGVNVLAMLGSAAWDAGRNLNNKNLGIAFDARSSGMSEDQWIEQRKRLSSSGYLSEERTARDIKSLGVAAGGLSLGMTEGAERIVSGTRGLITFGDINRYESDASGLLEKFNNRFNARYGSSPKAQLKRAAMAEASGLNAAAGTSKADQSLKALNDGFARVDASIANLHKSAGTKFGEDIGTIAHGVGAIIDFFTGKNSTENPTGSSKANPNSGTRGAELYSKKELESNFLTKERRSPVETIMDYLNSDFTPKSSSMTGSKLYSKEDTKPVVIDVTIGLTEEARQIVVTDGRVNSKKKVR